MTGKSKKTTEHTVRKKRTQKVKVTTEHKFPRKSAGNTKTSEKSGANTKRSKGKRPSTRGRTTANRRPSRHESSNSGRSTKKEASVIIPPVGENIRIIPLGGVEEVGKNMLVVEYGSDIVVMDVGFQFVGEEEAPGIDYVLPNTKYLEENKDRIRGVIITHGHLDHIGGIPYIMKKIGNPPIFTRELTTIMIKKRQEEYPHLPPLDMHVVEPGDKVTFKSLAVKFFPVTHSIPDSMGVSIQTPDGNVVITGDLKLDHENGKPSKREEKTWGELGKQKNLLFIADSTNAEQPGFSITEKTIHANIEKIIKDAPGRLIIGTFASQFERMIKIVGMCEKYGKKVIPEGRSIKTNLEVAQKAGLLKAKKDTIIPVAEAENYPPDRIVVIATGAQGEEFAALMRISTHKHKFIKLNARDTVVLSSSVIPGNEISVQKLKDNLYRHGAKIIHYRTAEVHSTGHGKQEELAWFNKQVHAKFFMPGYGYHSMLRVHAEVAERAGMPRENIIIPDDGMIIEITDKGEKINILKEKAPSNIVMVDGFSVGDVKEVVIRDRQMLSQDGIFVVIAIVDTRTGKVRKSPDIISRGFVYLKESQDLLRQARYITKKSIEDITAGMNPIEFDFIKGQISDQLSAFLLQQTAKRPIVLPVLIGV